LLPGVAVLAGKAVSGKTISASLSLTQAMKDKQILYHTCVLTPSGLVQSALYGGEECRKDVVVRSHKASAQPAVADANALAIFRHGSGGALRAISDIMPSELFVQWLAIVANAKFLEEADLRPVVGRAVDSRCL
jgi:hypothetical protein